MDEHWINKRAILMMIMPRFTSYFVALLSLWLTTPLLLSAQDTPLQPQAYIQLEAHSTLKAATRRISTYAGRLDDISGFRLKSGWYGIVLGPEPRSELERTRRQLAKAGRIPRDSFITTQRKFGQRFWPVGEQEEEQGTSSGTAPKNEHQDNSALTQAPQAPAAATKPKVNTQSLADARASEAGLSRDEKKQLQIALEWAGFYNSTIDGSFGRGTRRAMREWQKASGYKTTGVLTTFERSALFKDYTAILDGLDMRTVQDLASGLEVKIPSAVVAFARYAPPFVQFKSKTDLNAQILFFSQLGTKDDLRALFDVLQTLEIFPPQGPRKLNRQNFEITGESSKIHSYATVRLSKGELKGYALIWPAGDDKRRERVLQEMAQSFTILPGTLDPSAFPRKAVDTLDTVSGLKVRRAKSVQSGTFIHKDGTVLTADSGLESCANITLGDELDMRISFTAPEQGLTVLTPSAPLAPLGVAQVAATAPRIKSELVTAGYPFGGVLNAPSITYATLADTQGLSGDLNMNRLQLNGDIGTDFGGAVFDLSGAMVGMVLPLRTTGQALPKQVALTAPIHALEDGLAASNFKLAANLKDAPELTPAELIRKASNMTVLIKCWE